MKNLTALAILSLLISGCTTTSAPALQSSDGVTVVPSGSLPPPDQVDTSSLERPYFIGPFDKLMIDVYGVEELSKREVQADASGRISFPLAGQLAAAGKTPAQLAELIEGRLRGSYIRNPQVTVNLMETVSQVVTVDGEVKEPGLYPVLGRMTLMRAVATAKGTTEFANTNHVVVFRRVNDQQYAALYDLRAIRQGAYPDPEIYPNDVVQVGEARARRLFRDVLQGAPLLLSPIIALLGK